MPCLPDEFEIIITDYEALVRKQPLDPYLIDGYYLESYSDKFNRSSVHRYKKAPQRLERTLPVHDILLRRMNSQVTNHANET